MNGNGAIDGAEYQEALSDCLEGTITNEELVDVVRAAGLRRWTGSA